MDSFSKGIVEGGEPIENEEGTEGQGLFAEMCLKYLQTAKHFQAQQKESEKDIMRDLIQSLRGEIKKLEEDDWMYEDKNGILQKIDIGLPKGIVNEIRNDSMMVQKLHSSNT